MLLIYISISILFLHLVVKLFTSNTKIQWFAIHVWSNLLITLLVGPTSIHLLKDPCANIESPTTPYTLLAFETVSVIHIYHMIFFKCNAADYFHHITFVTPLLLLRFFVAPMLGNSIALNLLFVCGFPGGIDYFCLILVECKLMKKKTRVELSCTINNWIRAPGSVLAATLHYLRFLVLEKNIRAYITFAIGCLTSYVNGHYYLQQVLLTAGNKYDIKGS